ncbi:MAG: NAD(P)H-hydrate dehydratase [Candidatus Pacebacteria bacterium]|nr:NAD(P)H-hydrate dehydratase [Candidatus Paceibacterota bacterium]
MDQIIQQAFKNLTLPDPNSHKGQNGKLLLVGGSELFHAASKWSLDIASKIVDMVFYTSVPENNELIKQAKQNFWNGIVIQRQEIAKYIVEADCILIGPGMDRSENTEKITNNLLKNYPEKKFVVDAGALQMVNPKLLNHHHIITPHSRELEVLKTKNFNPQEFPGVTLIKGQTDQIINQNKIIEITGGNAGMTKGGTGDVLAGLIAALYCKNDVLTATITGSYTCKTAGDQLYSRVGPYFNASDLVEEIPKVLWQKQLSEQ